MVAAIGLEKPEKFQLFERIGGLDAIGVEPYWAFTGGNVQWVAETCATAAERVHAVGRELDIWAQNFGIKREHEPDLVEVYRIVGATRPDAIWNFWYWRACDDPAEVMRLTRIALAAILS
jgi:hypothetical protein